MEKLEYIRDLCSGATISQTAQLFKTQNILDYSTEADLGYSDLINSTLGLNIISEFYDVPATVFVKNNTLTSVALGKSISDSLIKAIDSNPFDSICGVVVFSQDIDMDTANLLTPQHLVITPSISESVKQFFESNKIKYVVINTPLKEYKNYLIEEVFVTPFGTVVQNTNKSELDKDMFKVLSKAKPTVEQVEDSIFAWKISKYLKSSSTVVVKDFKTFGIAQGLQSKSVEYALNCACDNAKDAVLAVDTPLNLHDMNAIIQDRISLVIQPGVSEEVLKMADKYGICMISTGISNFSLY